MDPSGSYATDSENQALLRSLARDVARRIAPDAPQWDEEEMFPLRSWEVLRTAGLLGITVGPEFGGTGLGDAEAAIVLEELARADVSTAIICQLMFNGPPRIIEHLGSEALKEKWLPLAGSGEALFCIGITEPDSGSAAHHMRAHLTPDGKGYRLNAYKNYVTAGHVARACLVWCRFPGGFEARGIGAVVVNLHDEGVSVVGTHKKMGLRGCTEAELAFDDVRIEPQDVLLAAGPDDGGPFRTLLAHLNHERCGNAAMCLGAAQAALELALDYMRDRKLGDRPLADFQGLQWKIADMAVALEGARLLLRRAISLAAPGGTPPPLETAMAKAAANLAAKTVCDEALQILGGYGYSREYPVERMYRDIRGLSIGAGTVEVQRNFIARSLLSGRVPDAPWWQTPSI